MSGPAPAFSYAQAAKGLVSSQNSATSSRLASGAITPAKDGMTSPVIPAINGTAANLTENLTALKNKEAISDADSSKPTLLRKSNLPTNGTASPPSPAYVDSSISTLNREDDLSSIPNASSESAWENVSQSSAAQETVKPSTSDNDEQNGAKMDNSWVQIQKPAAEVEAPPPSVNIWQQRLEQAAKKGPVPNSSASPTENGLNIQGLKKEQTARERVQPRQSARDDDSRAKKPSAKRPVGDEKPPVAPPPMRDQTLWPTPETHIDAERKQSLDKIQADKDKAKGKKAWVTLDMPPPTVVFNTNIPNTHGRRGGRPGGRGGREGGNRGSPPGRNQREERQGSTAAGQPRPERDSARQSTSPKGKRSDDASSRRDSRFVREGAPREVNGDSGKPVGTEEGKPQSVNNVARNGPKNVRRDVASADFDKKEVRQDGLNVDVSAAASDSSSAARSAPLVVSDEPKQGSVTEPLGVGRFPSRNGNGPLPFQPASRRGSVRGRGGNHAFHSPGHQAPVFQNFSMNRSPPMPHDSFYGQPHGGRGGFRGGRNQSVPTDWNGRFNGGPTGPYHHQTGMLPPLNTFVGPSELMYDQPQPQPMSAVPYTYHLAQYNLVGSVSLQIEYYFSLDNLIKDDYLRKQMDSQGFVLLTTLSEFKRLRALTQDVDLLRFICQSSHALEWRLGVDGKDRVRVRDGWQQWVLEKSKRDPVAQNDGVDGQQVVPADYNMMSVRQNSMPGHFPAYPASAYPAVNGHSHQEFFPSPPGDPSNYARFQASPPIMGQPFSPPGQMMDPMMRSPHPSQYPKELEHGMQHSADKMAALAKSPIEQHRQPVPTTNGVTPSGPNGTAAHE
jgi:la-related protein 1